MQAALPENAEERALLELISHDPRHVDDLIRESGLATTTVTATLMMMETIAHFWYIKSVRSLLHTQDQPMSYQRSLVYSQVCCFSPFVFSVRQVSLHVVL